MNVNFMSIKDFRKMAKKSCGYMKTPSVACGHAKRSHKYCYARGCPVINDMQIIEDLSPGVGID